MLGHAGRQEYNKSTDKIQNNAEDEAGEENEEEMNKKMKNMKVSKMKKALKTMTMPV